MSIFKKMQSFGDRKIQKIFFFQKKMFSANFLALGPYRLGYRWDIFFRYPTFYRIRNLEFLKYVNIFALLNGRKIQTSYFQISKIFLNQVFTRFIEFIN